MNRGLDWRWIAIGTAVMFGLNLVAGFILLPLLGGALPAGPDGAPSTDAAAALGGGRLLLAALVSFLSFATGGYVVGARSPGRTIVEPGISTAIAVAISLLMGCVHARQPFRRRRGAVHRRVARGLARRTQGPGPRRFPALSG